MRRSADHQMRPSLPLMDLTIDADRTPHLVDRHKHDLVVEDDELFGFEANLGEGAEPFLQEPTNCRSAFEKVPHRPPGEARIRSKEAHYRVDVMLIRSLEGKARKLDQVGGRGLLRHRLSIPDRASAATRLRAACPPLSQRTNTGCLGSADAAFGGRAGVCGVSPARLLKSQRGPPQRDAPTDRLARTSSGPSSLRRDRRVNAGGLGGRSSVTHEVYAETGRTANERLLYGTSAFPAYA